jgi:hypothetical protein
MVFCDLYTHDDMKGPSRASFDVFVHRRCFRRQFKRHLFTELVFNNAMVMPSLQLFISLATSIAPVHVSTAGRCNAALMSEIGRNTTGVQSLILTVTTSRDAPFRSPLTCHVAALQSSLSSVFCCLKWSNRSTISSILSVAVNTATEVFVVCQLPSAAQKKQYLRLEVHQGP